MSEPRTKLFTMRVTEAERAQIEDLSFLFGCPSVEVVRRLVAREAEKHAAAIVANARLRKAAWHATLRKRLR